MDALVRSGVRWLEKLLRPMIVGLGKPVHQLFSILERVVRHSYAPILLVLFLGAVADLFLYYKVKDLERQRIQTAFTATARDRVLVIQREIEHALGVVQDIGSFFENSPYVTRRDFREFVIPALKRNPGIQALSWAPKIGNADKATFISRARNGLPGFQITEQREEGLQPVLANRQVYYPIFYIQPYPPNKPLLGLDLAADPQTAAALAIARQGQELYVSPPRLLPETNEPGFLVYLPVFDLYQGEETEEAEDTQRPLTSPDGHNLRGFALGLFRLGAIVKNALSHLVPSGIDVHLMAPDEQGRLQPIVSHQSRLRVPDSMPLHVGPKSTEWTYREHIRLANQEWTVMCNSIPGHYQPDSYTTWVIFGGGLAFTLLFAAYLFTLIGRAEQVKRLVSQRTLQLEQSYIALNNEIAERHRAEDALMSLNATLEQRVAQRTAEAERRAQELEQFAYVASHDLKAPLRAIANLAGWLKEDLEGSLTPVTRDQLDLLRDRVSRMHALIEGLLAYSRIGRTEGAIEEVDVAELVAETIDSLAPPPGFRIEMAPNMPKLWTNRLHLGQVFANLIGNSLKHHHREQGRIWISGRDLGDYCLFSVADDGPGIDPEYHDKVFLMFQTLEVRDFGAHTGIGLALVKKLVEEQGGRIRLDSALGRGARFEFTWYKGRRGVSELSSATAGGGRE